MVMKGSNKVAEIFKIMQQDQIQIKTIKDHRREEIVDNENNTKQIISMHGTMPKSRFRYKPRTTAHYCTLPRRSKKIRSPLPSFEPLEKSQVNM